MKLFLLIIWINIQGYNNERSIMNTTTRKQLLSRTATICRHHKTLSRLSGSDFNIFKIIKVTGDELRHSSFLAEMLNPRGLHGQATVFLDLFLKKYSIENFHSESAEVFLEKHIGTVTETSGGKIDILIQDSLGNKIIIENKIYARDQKNQLIRYSRHGSKNLFYLTLFGDMPDAISIRDESNGIELLYTEEQKDFIPISYKDDIIQWLEQCQKEAALLPLLREGIQHYINLLKELTGQSYNKAMNKEIIDLINENPAMLESAIEISNHMKDAQAELQWKFWKNLKESLGKHGVELKDTEHTVDMGKTYQYYHKKARYFGLWSCVYQKDDISIHWGAEVFEYFYTGFTIEKAGEGRIADEAEYAAYRSVVKSIDSDFREDPHWLGWKSSNPQLRFLEFNSDPVLKLTQSDYLKEIVDNIAKQAAAEIMVLKQKLAQFE